MASSSPYSLDIEPARQAQELAHRQHLPAQSGLSLLVDVFAACALAARLQGCRVWPAAVKGLTCAALRSLSCMLATACQKFRQCTLGLKL